MTARLWTIAVVALIWTAWPGAAESTSHVGSISSLEGEVFVQRADTRLAAEKGMRLEVGDTVVTGKDGGVGIVLRDDTTLSLGKNSEVAMEQFDFEPAEGILAMTLSVVKGTMACLTGRIAELAPESMRVETPAGIMGVRGTKFIVEVRP